VKIRPLLFAVAWLLGLGFWGTPLLAAPRVVASIKPLAGLATMVLDGVGEPQLLLPGGSSPHSYALRPSQMRALHAADLVIWVGPQLESFLAKPLRDPSLVARSLQATALPGLHLLPAREGGAWGDEDHGHLHGHGHDSDNIDPHLWLDPGNARLLVRALARRLEQIDAAHAARYRSNADAAERRLAELQEHLQARLAPLTQVPYLVFHDAYQYFETVFDLHPLGALAIHPDRNPGARRIREMRRQIVERGAACVFSEPQFEPRLVDALVEGTGARHGELDPIGATLPAGPGFYAALLNAMAAGLESCLTP